MIRELVVISGKGGTGKTSLAASLAVLAQKAVIADCDVDAPDLHILLQPENRQKHPFISGIKAEIDNGSCTACDDCILHCPFEAIHRPPGSRFPVVDSLACEGCKVCGLVCRNHALVFRANHCGHHFVSDTRCGPMVHAKLDPGAGNSGKLVSLVRQKARKIAENLDLDLVITDGPPGIGCPVIASITGATHVLAVTEPSVSGMHDLERLLELTSHFRVPASVCVNRHDIHETNAEQIRQLAKRKHATFAGFIPWDPSFKDSQKLGKTVVETDSAASRRIIEIWKNLQTFLDA